MKILKVKQLTRPQQCRARHLPFIKKREQHFKLKINAPDSKLEAGEDVGKASPKGKKEVLLSQLICRLNELFITDELT